MIKVSIIIPHSYDRNILKRCLNSLLKSVLTEFELIIVDNNSQDESILEIIKVFPKSIIIPQKKNFGFSQAVNTGISKAKGEFILLLNDDTEIDKSSIKSLVELLEKKPEIVAVTGKIISMENNNIIESVGDNVNAALQPFPRGKGDPKDRWNTGELVTLITAGGSLYRRDIFKKVGLFDEAFFAYYEDVDWSLRAQLLGYKLWYEPKAIIYHKGKNTSNRKKNFLEYLLFRNWMLLIIKHLPLSLFFKRQRYLIIPLVYFHTLFYFLKKNLLKETILANLWILIHLPRLFQSRAKTQQLRKIDLKIFEKLMIDKKINFGIQK